MTPDVQFLLLLAVIALLFITELIPLAVTSIGGAVACGLLGFITPKAVFSGLSILQYSICRHVRRRCSNVPYRAGAEHREKVVSVFGTSEKA